jgi:hypothetical protein
MKTFWLVLLFPIFWGTNILAQDHGIINCEAGTSLAAWEKPDGLVMVRKLSCGRIVGILGMERGWVKIQITDEVIGYVKAVYIQAGQVQESKDGAARLERQISELEDQIKELKRQPTAETVLLEGAAPAAPRAATKMESLRTQLPTEQTVQKEENQLHPKAVPASMVGRDVHQTSYDVTYDGGSLTNVRGGSNLKLYINSSSVRFAKGKADVLAIPASAITDIAYGQDVHRRVGTAVAVSVVSFGLGALTALTKSKKHFIGLTWANDDQKGGLAIQCDKNDYRGILAALEGISGRKVLNSENMTVKN